MRYFRFYVTDYIFKSHSMVDVFFLQTFILNLRTVKNQPKQSGGTIVSGVWFLVLNTYYNKQLPDESYLMDNPQSPIIRKKK